MNKKTKKKENYNSNNDESESESNYEYNMESSGEIKSKDYIKNENKNKIRNNKLNKNNEKKIVFKEKNKNDNSSSNKNIKINININLTNNNNSTFNFFGLPQLKSHTNNNNINKNSLNIRNRNKKIITDYEEENDISEKTLIKSSIFLKDKAINIDDKIKNCSNYHYIDNNGEKSLNKKYEEVKDINIIEESINQLYKKYQLSHEINDTNCLLNDLNTFYNILKDNIANNQIHIKYLDKLLNILNLSMNQNNNIREISLNIKDYIKEYVINDLFLLSEKDKNILKEELNILNFNNQEIKEDDLIDEKLFQEINQLMDMYTTKQNDIEKQYNNDDISGNDNEKNEEKRNKLLITINEEFYNVINNLKNEKQEKKFDFEKISEKFYKEIYDKKNNGLDYFDSLKRKKVCINLLHLIRKILPKHSDDLIKRMIIYYEYQIRNEYPLFGENYYFDS